MNGRVRNAVSLTLNLAIVFFVGISVYYNLRNDVIRDASWFGYTGVKSLVFFTNLSNIFIAITSAVTIAFNFKNAARDSFDFPFVFKNIKYTSTVAITLTCVTVVFFLAPYAALIGHSYFDLFRRNNIYTHLLVPILAIINFLVVESNDDLGFKSVFYGVIPTVIYSVVYLVMVVFIGEANGGWVDFYGFTFGGRLWTVPLSFTGMYAATFVISWLLYLIQKKICVKRNKNRLLEEGK